MDLPDFGLNPIEKIKLERQFEKLDLAAIDKDDEFLVWRTKVNQALARESLSAVWHEDYAYMTLQPIGAGEGMLPFIHVPKLHLEDLYEQKAHPEAVGSYFRAVMYDERFKLWNMEDEDEG